MWGQRGETLPRRWGCVGPNSDIYWAVTGSRLGPITEILCKFDSSPLKAMAVTPALSHGMVFLGQFLKAG